MQFLGLFIQFVLLVALQKLVFGNLTLWGIAFANIAVLFPLFLPTHIPKAGGLLIVFVFALVLDIFMLSTGIQTFAMLATYFVREYWFRIITPMARLESEDNISIEAETHSVSWLVSYIVPLVFFFQLLYFTMADFSITGVMMLKVIASTVYSGLFCFLVALLIYRKSAKRD